MEGSKEGCITRYTPAKESAICFGVEGSGVRVGGGGQSVGYMKKGGTPFMDSTSLRQF